MSLNLKSTFAVFLALSKHKEVYLYAYDCVNDEKQGLEKYFKCYNHERPSSSLDDKTPDEFYFNNLLVLFKAA